jgi:hypothetical protein
MNELRKRDKLQQKLDTDLFLNAEEHTLLQQLNQKLGYPNNNQNTVNTMTNTMHCRVPDQGTESRQPEWLWFLAGAALSAALHFLQKKP